MLPSVLRRLYGNSSLDQRKPVVQPSDKGVRGEVTQLRKINRKLGTLVSVVGPQRASPFSGTLMGEVGQIEENTANTCRELNMGLSC
jgi:hypothetical protein